MKTIWLFGDSFTFGIGCTCKPYYEKYYKESYDVWFNILEKKSGYPINNLGKCGASNDMIFDTIIESFDDINQNDIVIIQKTLGNYEKFDIQWSDESNFKTEYRIFSSNIYKERQNKRFDFIKKQLLKKVDTVYIWDIDDVDVKPIQRITQHTNYEFKDFHFSFIGHEQFANHLYNYLFFRSVKPVL
jgi:hypothetical protein